jgi:DNA-directed RNA polymerase subunit RPC12/RpoP
MDFKEIEERARNEVRERLERIKKSIEEERARERIICPYCNHTQDNESMYGHVSYWGDNDDFEIQCERCDEKFICKEEVKRQFWCRKMGEENAG